MTTPIAIEEGRLTRSTSTAFSFHRTGITNGRTIKILNDEVSKVQNHRHSNFDSEIQYSDLLFIAVAIEIYAVMGFSLFYAILKGWDRYATLTTCVLSTLPIGHIALVILSPESLVKYKITSAINRIIKELEFYPPDHLLLEQQTANLNNLTYLSGESQRQIIQEMTVKQLLMLKQNVSEKRFQLLATNMDKIQTRSFTSVTQPDCFVNNLETLKECAQNDSTFLQELILALPVSNINMLRDKLLYLAEGTDTDISRLLPLKKETALSLTFMKSRCKSKYYTIDSTFLPHFKGKQRECQLNEEEIKCLSIFENYLKSGDKKLIKNDNVKALLNLAVKFETYGLATTCANFIIHHFERFNANETLSFLLSKRTHLFNEEAIVHLFATELKKALVKCDTVKLTWHAQAIGNYLYLQEDSTVLETLKLVDYNHMVFVKDLFTLPLPNIQQHVIDALFKNLGHKPEITSPLEQCQDIPKLYQLLEEGYRERIHLGIFKQLCEHAEKQVSTKLIQSLKEFYDKSEQPSIIMTMWPTGKIPIDLLAANR